MGREHRAWRNCACVCQTWRPNLPRFRSSPKMMEATRTLGREPRVPPRATANFSSSLDSNARGSTYTMSKYSAGISERRAKRLINNQRSDWRHTLWMYCFTSHITPWSFCTRSAKFLNLRSNTSVAIGPAKGARQSSREKFKGVFPLLNSMSRAKRSSNMISKAQLMNSTCKLSLWAVSAATSTALSE